MILIFVWKSCLKIQWDGHILPFRRITTITQKRVLQEIYICPRRNISQVEKTYKGILSHLKTAVFISDTRRLCMSYILLHAGQGSRIFTIMASSRQIYSCNAIRYTTKTWEVCFNILLQFTTISLFYHCSLFCVCKLQKMTHFLFQYSSRPM